MKGHIGTDSRTKLIHSVLATGANEVDANVMPELLHGDEATLWADEAYRGQREAIKRAAPRTHDFTQRRYRYRGEVDEEIRSKNRTKSSVRSKGEHPFHVIKRVFGFRNVRYRGLMKNTNRQFTAYALTNLFIARGHLMRMVLP